MIDSEKPFYPVLKIIGYTRNIYTKKITEIKFNISASGLKDVDGNKLPGIGLVFTVPLPDNVDTAIPNSDLTKELMHYWVNTYVTKELMKEYEKSVYNAMYPDTVFETVHFSYDNV